MCRVIYTLHGSLSQEKSVMKELQERLAFSQEKIEELCETNSTLRAKWEDTEDKCKQMEKLNALQREKIVLLTPTKFSKQTFYHSSPLTSSPKVSHRPPAHPTSSPRLTHHPPAHCTSYLGTGRAVVGSPIFMEGEKPPAEGSPAGAKGSHAPRKVIRGPQLTGSTSRERQHCMDEDGNVV